MVIFSYENNWLPYHGILTVHTKGEQIWRSIIFAKERIWKNTKYSKAAAELNEIMHAAHINASDRAVYASGMLLAMHVLTPDSLYATEDTASHYIYRHLMDFLKDQLSPEMYQMTAREFQVLTSDPKETDTLTSYIRATHSISFVSSTRISSGSLTEWIP